MKLIVAEKPSVARTIAAAIGATSKGDGCISGSGYTVTWCIGHLIQLASTDAYNKDYATWRKSDLPIFPETMKYEVSKETKEQFEIIKKLMNDDRYDAVICATDAGREGELIFRLVYNQAKCRKPILRLWLSSMEEAAIREGMAALRPGAEFEKLYEAALCRQTADWLVGINATRLFSITYGTKLNVGRVMSPTLALVAERDAAIKAFTSVPFFAVNLDLGAFTAISPRFDTRSKAEEIAAACFGKTAAITNLKTEKKKQNSPLLLDLTTLQREANRLFGYTAQQTLDYAQSLYEKQLITYPRTDSRYLTDDMFDTAQLSIFMSAVAQTADIPESFDVKKLLNSKKVTDHHAIIITRIFEKFDMETLPSGEKSIFDLICLSILKAASQAYEYEETTVTLKCNETEFTAKGKVELKRGWRVYETDESSDKSDAALPPLSEGDVHKVRCATVKEGKTTPPKHYTEASLLGAMETAGAKETPDEAERKGLGTPATRAAIIEKLVKVGFLTRVKQKKTTYILSTESGNALISVLPESLQSPLLTAEWENMLLQIERGTASPQKFLDGIKEMLLSLIAEYKPLPGSETLFPKEERKKPVGKCPRCGADVFENKKGFCCTKCSFAIWKNDRFFTSSKVMLTSKIVSELIKNGKVRIEKLYSPKKNKTYAATVIMDPGTADSKYVKWNIEFS